MFFFLEATAGEASAAGSMFTLIIPLALMFVFMYFAIILPDKKKKKKAEEMRSNLSLGEEITTIGGLTGKVVQVTEETVTFETGEDRVRIQIMKWAIQSTAKMEAEEAKSKRK